MFHTKLSGQNIFCYKSSSCSTPNYLVNFIFDSRGANSTNYFWQFVHCCSNLKESSETRLTQVIFESRVENRTDYVLSSSNCSLLFKPDEVRTKLKKVWTLWSITRQRNLHFSCFIHTLSNKLPMTNEKVLSIHLSHYLYQHDKTCYLTLSQPTNSQCTPAVSSNRYSNNFP